MANITANKSRKNPRGGLRHPAEQERKRHHNNTVATLCTHGAEPLLKGSLKLQCLGNESALFKHFVADLRPCIGAMSSVVTRKHSSCTTAVVLETVPAMRLEVNEATHRFFVGGFWGHAAHREKKSLCLRARKGMIAGGSSLLWSARCGGNFGSSARKISRAAWRHTRTTATRS